MENPKIYTDVKKFVRSERRKRDLTQEQLAEKVGVSTRTIQYLEEDGRGSKKLKNTVAKFFGYFVEFQEILKPIPDTNK